MAQPIATFTTANMYAGIIDFGTKIMVGKDVLRFDSLSPEKFVYPDFQQYKVFAFETVGGIYGSEYAFIPFCRVSFGTFHFNPNNRPNAASIILSEDGNIAYVSAIAKIGIDRYTVSAKSLKLGTRVGGANNSSVRCGIGVKVGQDIINFICEEYYDRTYSFPRDTFQDGTVKQVHNTKITTNYSSFSFLWNTDSKVYMALLENKKLSVISYDMSSKATTNLKYVSKGRGHTRHPSNFLPLDKDSDTKRFYAVRTDNQNQLNPELWTLDIAGNSCTAVDCTVNWNGFTPTINVNDNRFALTSWITENGDKLYLHCATICRGDYNPSGTKYGIYTFLINKDNPQELEFINFTEFPGKIYSLLALTLNKDKLVCSTAVDTYTATFDGSQWNTYSLEVGTAKSMLYDRLGRLWISTGDKLYRMTPTLAVRADIEFDPAEVVWDGTTKQVKIYVEARNLYGERISTTGKLIVVYGDLEFEGGAKETTITTSTSGPVSVDAYLKGPSESEVIFVEKV